MNVALTGTPVFTRRYAISSAHRWRFLLSFETTTGRG
jgi:hypothetical protein